MKKRKFIFGVIITFMVAFSLLGCSTKDKEESTTQNTEQSSKETDDNNENDQTDDLAIDTKYGELHYPGQWSEFIQTAQNEDNDTIDVSFSAKIAGETYPLFTIVIGGNGEDSVGKITDADGNQHNVYVQMQEISNTEDLTDGEENRLYAMQEDLNYVISKLK